MNYSILFIKNKVNSSEIPSYYLMHCAWDLSSAFISSIPLHINQNFIISDNFVIEESEKQLCLCTKSLTKYCCKGIVGQFYPGQTISFNFAFAVFTNAAYIEILGGILNCTCHNDKIRLFQLEPNKCKPFEYKIQHNNDWCELRLKATSLQKFPGFNKVWSELYTVTLQPCPKGFSLHPQGYCKCDPILSSHIPSLTTCDIDHQTIPRPANTWISAHTINNSHSYHVSLHCPFDYCLPHSSQLSLSTPDSQCQFNRSGVLCGQCQHGLSTVFGSSQCKHCSNINLLMIIPIYYNARIN